MKKIIAMLLAVVMAAAMVVPVFAEDPTSTTVNSAKDHSIDVQGKFSGASASGDVISVGIAWDAMTFTYSEASAGTWNPANHAYTGNSTAGWSDNKSGITVTNHSNVPVDAEFSFAAATGVTTTGTFYHKLENNAFSDVAMPNFRLASAVGTEVSAAPSGTIYFGVSGAAISSDTTLGTITVKIAKSKTVKTVTVNTTEITQESGATFSSMNIVAEVTYDDNSTATIRLDADGMSIYCNGDTPTLISANDDISTETKEYYVEYEGKKSNNFTINVAE